MATSSSPGTAPRRSLEALDADQLGTLMPAFVRAWPEAALLVHGDGRVLAASPAAFALAGIAEPGPSACASVNLETFVGAAAAARLLGRDGPPAREATGSPTGGPSLAVRARVGHLGPDHLLVALADVRAELRLETHLTQAERLASIGELLSSVAHELTNPLTSVLGYAELLLTEEDPSYPLEEIERIRSEAVRCRRIVSNLLDLARAEALEMRPLSLALVVDKVLEFRGYASKVHEVDLVTECDAGLPMVDGDFHRLVQATLNLVTNAEHAVEARAAGKRVCLRARVEDGYAVLEVEDNGPGVPADLREAIFQPFFTTKPRGKGTGLGLSLVRATAESHGGTVRVDAGAEGGALFTLRLPLAN